MHSVLCRLSTLDCVYRTETSETLLQPVARTLHAQPVAALAAAPAAVRATPPMRNFPVLAGLLACVTCTAYGQDDGETKHAYTVEHIQSKNGISVQELMEHLGDVHKEHYDKKHAKMLAEVEGLPRDLSQRDTDNDGGCGGPDHHNAVSNDPFCAANLLPSPHPTPILLTRNRLAPWYMQVSSARTRRRLARVTLQFPRALGPGFTCTATMKISPKPTPTTMGG